MLNTKLKNTVEYWPMISKIISVPNSDKEYNKLVKTLDELIDEVGNNEKHPLASLMSVIGLLIENYENKHFPMPEASGADVLKYLMEEHNIKQSELPEIGSQGVVSEILNEKRELNIRQIKLLAKRFSVSTAVFT